MHKSNIQIPQAVDVLHNDLTAPLISQDLFEKTQGEWRQKNPNKPMPWSHWNPIFRKAGIAGDEGVAVYDKAYPPTRSKPAIALPNFRPEGASLDSGEVLLARRLLSIGGQFHDAPHTISKGEWFSMAQGQGISDATRNRVWRDRKLVLPLTPEENLEFNQITVMHELGHASMAVYLKLPFKGIGLGHASGMLEEVPRFAASGFVFDFDALEELAREQGTDKSRVVLTFLNGERVNAGVARLQCLLAGELWLQRAIHEGLVPEWLHGLSGWGGDLHEFEASIR